MIKIYLNVYVKSNYEANTSSDGRSKVIFPDPSRRRSCELPLTLVEVEGVDTEIELVYTQAELVLDTFLDKASTSYINNRHYLNCY